MMPTWRLRDFHDDDLDRAIQIWDQDRQAEDGPAVFPVSEVMAAARSGEPAVVAVVGNDVVGMAVAQSQGDRAWITLVALAATWRNRGIGSSLIVELERRLRSRGTRRIAALLAPGATGTAALENCGYTPRGGWSSTKRPSISGRVTPGCWRSWAAGYNPGALGGTCRDGAGEGGHRTADRIAAGRARSGRPIRSAAAEGRHPFRATGHWQDQLRQGHRLPAGLAVRGALPLTAGCFGGRGLAASLRDAFGDLAELQSVVLFIDEVEEIAGVRSGLAADPARGVTNELLKLIPGFRDHDDRLMICATNSVRFLDPAFLRPGRFDYVIPVGPPDPVARAAIWRRYLGPAAAGVDLDRLVSDSEMFTPADIEFAARKGAHAAFERELADREGRPVGTEDFLAAVAETRPTLTDQALVDFREDIEQYVRV